MSSDAPVRIGPDVTAPVVISRVDPIYTEPARRARLTGLVILETIVDTNGDVKSAKVLKGLPFGLDRAAVECVIKWKFKPATRSGRPVTVYYNATVLFRLPPQVQ